MRFLQVLMLLVFLFALFVFALQNTQPVAVRFLGWSVSAPVPFLIIVVYVLGMLSGWTVFSFLGRSIRRAAEHRREK